jgi:hypothetical protein
MNTLQDIMGLFAKRKFKTPSDKDYIISAALSDTQKTLKPQPKFQSNLISIAALKNYIVASLPESFIGPKGDQGIQGIQGPAGLTGLFAQIADGGPVTNTIVETTIIGPGVGTLSVSANGFQIGDSFTCELDGLISCLSSAEIQIRIKTLSGVLLADTGIIDLAAATNKSWILNLYFTIRTLGTAGTASVSSGGLFSYIRNGGNQFEGYVLSLINNTTFDTTINNTLVVTVQWNTANVGNSILSRNFTLTKVY